MPDRKRYLARLLVAVGLPIAQGTCAGQPPAFLPPTAETQVIARSKPPGPTTLQTPTPLSAPEGPLTGPPPDAHEVPDDGLVGLPPIGTTQLTATMMRQVSYSPVSALPARGHAIDGASQPIAVLSRTSSLTVEVLGPAEIGAGATLLYEIVVRNPGALALAGVRVEEPVPAGALVRSVQPAPDVQGDRLVWNLGNIEANGERRIRIELQPGGQAEFVLNPVATFTALVGLRTRRTELTTVASTVPNAKTFVVSLLAPASVQRGSAVTLRIQVANRGVSPLTHVVLRTQLPPGLQHPAGNAIEADVGTLAPGQMKAFNLDVVALQVGRQVNEITAVAAGGCRAEAHTILEVTDTWVGVKSKVPDRPKVENVAGSVPHS